MTMTADHAESRIDDGSDLQVRIRDLRVAFRLRSREVVAIDGLDLDIRRGEFVVLVGPSGCGKTTLLRILAGLEEVTGGSVEVATDGAGAEVSSAMVFQEHGIFPWMTVRENIAFGLKAQGAGRAERRTVAEASAERVGLGAFLDAYPHQLSGGMRQRVSIARAMSTDPDLLLMDEPFAALDEQTKLDMQDHLLELWEGTNKTVVYVTHSLDEALVLGDRIVVMTGRPGRIRDVVNVGEVFARPRSVSSVRTHPRYGEMYGRLWSDLHPGSSVGSSEEVA